MDRLTSPWDRLRPKPAQLFPLTARSVAKEVLDLLNDAELHHLAYESVKAAAQNGLKGNEAFDAAFEALTVKLRAEGRELADNVKDTLIQNAYCVLKNATEE